MFRIGGQRRAGLRLPVTEVEGPSNVRLADTGIVVNCITPAAVETDIFKQMTEEHIKYMLSKIPMGRLGKPEEVAELVAWLCSDGLSFSTGVCYDISGGRATY